MLLNLSVRNSTLEGENLVCAPVVPVTLKMVLFLVILTFKQGSYPLSNSLATY